MSYDSTGAGARPTLGRGKAVGTPSPGGNQRIPSAPTEIPKVARPGGNKGHRRVSSAGMPPKAARPGRAGSIGGGGGTPSARPEW